MVPLHFLDDGNNRSSCPLMEYEGWQRAYDANHVLSFLRDAT